MKTIKQESQEDDNEALPKKEKEIERCKSCGETWGWCTCSDCFCSMCKKSKKISLAKVEKILDDFRDEAQYSSNFQPSQVHKIILELKKRLGI